MNGNRLLSIGLGVLVAFTAMAQDGVCGEIDAEDRESFVPEPGELSQRQGESEWRGIDGLFGSVIERANGNRRAAVENDLQYNEKRLGELDEKLAEHEEALHGLSDRYTVYFDRLTDRSGDDDSREYHAAVAQLKRQYDADKADWELEIEQLSGDLQAVRERIIKNKGELDWLEVEKDYATVRAPAPTRQVDEVHARDREAVEFFGELSKQRRLARAMRLVSLRPVSVDGLVLQRIINGDL